MATKRQRGVTDQLGVDRSRSTSWREHLGNYCSAHGGHGSHKQPMLDIAFSLDTVAEVADTQSRGIVFIEDTRKAQLVVGVGPVYAVMHVG